MEVESAANSTAAINRQLVVRLSALLTEVVADVQWMDVTSRLNPPQSSA